MNEIERAIESCRARHGKFLGDYQGDISDAHRRKLEKQMQIERVKISALEKQTPKRPHHMYRVLGEYELFGECPHCGHSGLRQGVHQCCWWCGQKLDWRNEDE